MTLAENQPVPLRILRVFRVEMTHPVEIEHRKDIGDRHAAPEMAHLGGNHVQNVTAHVNRMALQGKHPRFIVFHVFLRSIASHPAVDGKGKTVDECGFVTGKIQDGICHIAGSAQSAKRYLSKALGLALGILEKLSHQGSVHRTGMD